MIYGINFNGMPIPAEYLKQFRLARPIFHCNHCGKMTLATGPDCLTCFAGKLVRYKPQGESGMARLQGVAETLAEADAMRIQADNGHRKIFRVTNKVGEIIYGIYCY